MEYITYLTDYSTHAEVLTEQLVNRGHKEYQDYLVVVGGDGTLHEVVQTLYKNQADIPVTYVPAGTGNDFYRSWQKGLRSEEHTSELQSRFDLVCRLLLEKKNS